LKTADAPFWKTKTLAEMTQAEWESLCDGCAQCCQIRLEDEDTGELATTDVVCHLLDCGACRCTDYKNRATRVPDCLVLTPALVGDLGWLPASCAYRVLADGGDLAWWHPLVSGSSETVHEAGISVRGRAVSEADVPEEELLSHIIAVEPAESWNPPKRFR
jgi:uncharacterized cysteine cluster protein YcgN (CxxCxxCC family)